MTSTIGLAAAVFYAHQGLTLSHYDARAHLVVARRITDSLTPGWRQIGAVWLPLPHLLDLVTVQTDWGYRTGYPAVLISVLSLSVGLAAFAWYVVRRTGSVAAGLVGPALILLNPNVLYLQSTPMTEPLLFGLSLLALVTVDRWIEMGTAGSRQVAGWVIIALALTRYEGWCVAVALIGVAAAARWADGPRRALALAPYFLGAVGAFLLLGRGSTGHWFVTSGFFVPDNPARGSVPAALAEIARTTLALGGPAVVLAGGAGLLLGLAALARGRWRSVLPLTLASAGALPLLAFYDGHPLRVRYMVPLVAAAGVLGAVAVARLPRRAQAVAAVLLGVWTVTTRPPLDPHAPMVLEAQWETPYRIGREAVTRYLSGGAWDGTPILASMGALGHYMQESSKAGFNIADFLHEGNGDLWTAAVARPERYVNWILVEERAEGGGLLAQRARRDPSFLAGFNRVAEGGGMALYRLR